MLLTVVYENFSYVYQRAGKLALFSREETRKFKKTWAKFDPHATGYIRKDQIAKFFSQLRGLFEVRIYDEYHSVQTILQQCKLEADPTRAHTDIGNIDLHLLRNAIDRLPVDEIRERRRNYNILYEEAMISAEERGISFTRMLLMLAHYKFIDDNKALGLDDFLRRRAKLVRVTDRVREKTVRGFFQTMFWRRWFIAQRSQQTSYTGDIPSIVVEESETSMLDVPRVAQPSLDLTQMRNAMGAGYSPTTPAFTRADRLYTTESDEQDSQIRSWSNIGAPGSSIATSAVTSELSQPMDAHEASQIVQSLNTSAWGGAIRSPAGSRHSPGPSDGSGGSDARD